MKQTTSFFIFFLLFVNFSTFSQGYLSKEARGKYKYNTENKFVIKVFEEGMEKFNIGGYDEALDKFLYALDMEPSFSHANFFVAKSYYYLKDYEIAREYFQDYVDLGTEEKLFRNESRNLIHSIDKKIELENASKETTLVLEPLGIGPELNTEDDELFPFLSGDERTIYFIRRHTIESVSTANPEKGASEIGKKKIDEISHLMFSQKGENGKWQVPERVSGIDDSYYVGAFSVYTSGDISRIFFTSCERPEGHGGCDIYGVIKEGDNWYQAFNMGDLLNTPGFDGHPSISYDGSFFYFSSDREGSLGRQDIWEVTVNENGVWESPKNLGKTVNSFGSEQAPYIHANNKTLYFCTNSLTSFGGFDVFKTTRDKFNYTGRGWTRPENIGQPLNTFYDDISMYITVDSKTGYLSTKHIEGFGGYDIFSFDLTNAFFVAPATVDPVKKSYLSSSYENIVVGNQGFFVGTTYNFDINAPLDDLLQSIKSTKVKLIKENMEFSEFVPKTVNKDSVAIAELKEQYLTVFNNVTFTSDGKFFEFNSHFIHIDNRIKVGPEGLIIFDEGKLILKGKELIDSDGKKMSKTDILRAGIKGVFHAGDHLILDKLKITFDGKVISPDGYYLDTKGRMFYYKENPNKDDILIHDFNLKTGKDISEVDKIYSSSFQDLGAGGKNSEEKDENGGFSRGFELFMKKNNLSYNSEKKTISDSASVAVLKKGKIVLNDASTGAVVVSLAKGEFTDEKGQPVEKGRYKVGETSVVISDGVAKLSNDYSLSKDGFLKFPNGIKIHITLLALTTEGVYIEPYSF